MAPRLQDHGQPLPHIQDRRRNPARGRPRLRREKQGQQPEQAQPTGRDPRREQQNNSADHRQSQDRRSGLRHRQQVPGRGGDPLQDAPQGLQGPQSQAQQQGPSALVNEHGAGARQEQRQGGEADPGHRHQVRRQAEERDLLIVERQRGQQAQTGDILHPPPLPPPALRVNPMAQSVEQGRHGGKGQPETDGQGRARVKQQHGDEGQAQGVPGERGPAQQFHAQTGAQHDQGPLRGQGKTRQQRIEQGRRQGPRGGGPVARRLRQGGQGEIPRFQDEQVGKSGDEADMQAGNGDQMIGAGAGQRPPVGVLNPAAIPQSQGGDETRQVMLPRRRLEPIFQGEPEGVHMEGTGIRQFRVVRACRHIAGGPYPVLKQPGLVVKPAGIPEAIGPFQPHPQPPSLPRFDQRRLTVPAQPDQARIGRRRLPLAREALHLEIEAD